MHAKFVIILIVLFISAKSKDRITYIIKKIKENNLLYLLNTNVKFNYTFFLIYYFFLVFYYFFIVFLRIYVFF